VYPVAPQQQQQTTTSPTKGSNLPAILHNSMDKLQMNFIQNKSISEPENGKSYEPIEYQVKQELNSSETRCN
jgi:hypothetical protein